MEAFPAYSEISKHAKKEFPVLLQVTAPSLPPEVTSLHTPMRAAVDIVAVLDISASMTERMDGLKDAMLELVQQLHWEMDRLCIVAFSEKTDCSGFLKMNDTGKREAISIINNLNASGNNCCMGKALKDAAKVRTWFRSFSRSHLFYKHCTDANTHAYAKLIQSDIICGHIYFHHILIILFI